MKNETRHRILTDIDNLSPYHTTKETPDDRKEAVKILLSERLLDRTDRGGYILSKGGRKVIEAMGDLSVLDKPTISISGDNVHAGDNYGNYSQSSDHRKKTITDKITPKRVAISILIGVVTWLLIQYVIIPLIMS